MGCSVDYLITGCFGLLVGLGELVSRYRDAPSRAIFTLPAFVYVGINTGAAALALGALRVFNWAPQLGADTSESAQNWIQIVVAGLGAMAFFRSALFNVRIGSTDVAIGPSSVLELLLNAADRAVDRLRADDRARIVDSTMKAVHFQTASVGLPTFCLALMQNVSSEEQKKLASRLTELRAADMRDELKSLVLGLELLNIVGEDVLRAAVKALPPPAPNAPPVPGQPPAGPTPP
jgi:hypothetical protein